jgi:hypothetical protein
MQNPFFYPGKGVALRTVTGATGNVIADPVVTDIPNGSYSEGVAFHDCLEGIFSLEFQAGDATTDVDVETSGTQDFAVSEVYETLAVTGARNYSFNAGGPAVGFFRVRNSSGRVARVFHQKRIL